MSIMRETAIPQWFDEIFISKCIQNYFPEQSIKIHDFDTKFATANGENYLSYILRVKINYSNEKVHPECIQTKQMIMKLALDDPEMLKAVNPLNVYSKELEVYDKILPKIKVTMERAGDFEKIFADTIYVSHEHGVFTCEDLTALGYISNKEIGLDIEHTKIILDKLAKFHAVNAAIGQEDTTIFKNFQKALFSRTVHNFSKLFDGQLAALIDLLETWENYDYYVKKLRHLQPALLEKMSQAYDAIPHHFNTLIHSDIWKNNVMFLYNKTTNQPIDAVLLDYQFTCWASPALDLQYLFNTSLEEHLRLHHQEELVQYYHGKLATALKQYHYKEHIPTLHEFQAQYLEKAAYGFASAFLIQSFLLNDKSGEQVGDVDTLSGSGERALAYKRRIFQHPQVQANIKNLLPVFDRRGLLDV